MKQIPVKLWAKNSKPTAKEITTCSIIETKVGFSNDNLGDDYHTGIKTRNMSRKAQVIYFRKSEETSPAKI